MEENKKCPCDTVIELQKTTKEQEKRLNDGNTQFAVINTKLNLIMWVGGVLATASIGCIISMIMNK